MFRLRRPHDSPAALTEELVRREPMPSSRAIFWKPLPDSYYLLASMMRGASEQVHLFITQRAFMQVERHLRAAPELELGGFLAGHLYECTRTQARYCIINTVVPFAEVSPSAIGAHVTPAAHRAVRLRLESHGLVLIGWYRNGAGLGLQLLPDDIETHTEYFAAPWQCVLLVVPDATNVRGAFFTYDRRAGRAYCVPFYELFDQHAAEAKRLDTTCVTWKTYVPSTTVHPLPASEREVVETIVEPIRIPPDPEPKQPIDEWWDAIKDPWVRLRDVTISAKQQHVSPAREKRPNGRPASALNHPPIIVPGATTRPRYGPEDIDDRAAKVTPAAAMPARQAPAAPVQPVSASASVTSAPAVPLATPAPPTTVTFETTAQRASDVNSTVARPVAHDPVIPPLKAPPPVAPSPRAPEARKPNDTPPRHAPAAPPFAGPPAGGPPVRNRPPPRTPIAPRLIPPQTAEKLAAAASAPPAVALPPDFHDDAIRWQRRRRIGFAVAAVSFLGVIVLSSLRGRTTRADAAPAATDATSAVDSGSALVMPGSSGTMGLPIAVDSLSAALAYYRDIEDDHREGLVGCRVLDRAYELVGRARTVMDSARSKVPDGLQAADSIRVSMLGAELTHVAQTYRRSGCGLAPSPANAQSR